MFYLYSGYQGKNIKHKGKIIVFDSFEKANYFKQCFIQYSMQRMIAEDFFNISMVIATDQNMQILELTAESGIKDEDIILFENLKK